MKYSNTVEYNISTKLDASGLTKLQTQIKQIELTMQQMANRELLPAGRVEQARTQLEGLSSALTKSFDPSLGMLDLSKFRNELQQSKVTAEGLKSAFSMTGSQGAEAFGNLAKQIGNFNNGIERSSSSLDKMFTTFSNTFRWGLVSSFFSQFMNAIHQSVDYVKELDDSLTQIMLVTDYNRDSMNEYAKSANEAAKALSMSTTGMTNASLVFAQQGYDLNQSQELATLSAKVANASQQDTATTSDQITAYMNAYGLENSIGELTQAMDNWALIANISAADVGELAQASQRAASMASAVGVSGEQLASQIATIESVTREAPEQIGNGLKTLYARFSDIAAGGEDEDGFTLGKVTSELQAIGVQIFDQMGNIRDVGDIMEDLMVIWDDLDQTSKVAASQALAGKYQVNRFMALMDNSDMYQEYKGATGANAAGTLDIMNQEYAQSLAGRTQKLSTTLEGIFNNLFNTDSFYPFIDIAQKALDLIDNLTEAMGGGLPVLSALISGFTQLFSKNIARGINDMMSNQQIVQTRKSNLANVQGALADTGLDQTGVGQYIQAGADRAGIMNGEQYTIYTDQLDNYITAATNAAKANEHLEDTYMLVAAAAGEAFNDTDLLFKDEEGINTSTLIEVLNQYKDSKALMADLSKVDFSTATKSAQDFAKALSQLNGDLDRIKTGDRSGGEIWDIEQAEQDLYRVQEALYDLHEAGALTDQDFEKMKKTVEEAFDELSDNGTIEKTAQKFDEMNITIARFSEALQRIGPETLAKGPEAIQAAIMQEVAALEAEAAAAQGAEGVISNLDRQNVINSVVTLTSSLGQLASAWLTVQNLGSIWSNENLSGGEKFLQTILNLSMVIGQVTSAFDQLSKAQKTISTLYDKLSSTTQINATALKKNADAAKQAAESSSKDNIEKTKGIVTKTADTKITEKEVEANEKLKISQNGAAAAAGKDAIAQTADAVAKTEATVATTGLTAAVGALKKALDILTGPVGILITIFGMIAGAAWGAYQDQIEQMKQDAQEALDKAKSAQEQLKSIKSSSNEFNEKYNSYKQTGEGDKDLIEQANAIADAMREAGAEEQANAVHLATMRAEAAGTAENFDALANSINNAQESMSQDTNAEAITAANKLLETEKVSIEDVILHENMLKDAQEELNNLDPWDPNYESQKEQLESLIETLQNAKLAQEELVDAANVAVGAGVNSGMQEIAKTEGQQMQVYGKGDATGAGPPALAAGVMDWSAMQEYLSQTVEGFGALNELDQLAIAAQNVATEAQAAEIQVRQLLLANENLDESTTQHYSREGDYTLYGREGIQDVMQNEGFDSEQQVKILASLDENASEQEIMAKIQEIKAKMETTNDFDLALKATLDPEQAEEMLQNQINNYQPTDEDIDADQFKSMANYIHGADDSAFEEGGMFEDLSSDIRDNADALEDFVEGILRYEDAISTLAEKEEDWRNALADGADLADRVEAIDELKETYSDFLDLSDDVSNSFAENTEHLDDMAAAAEGDVDAYNRLLAAASEDIAVNIYGLDEASEGLKAMSEYLQSDDFKNVEVGMSINDEDFYSALNQMIAEGNWGREEIEAYLNNIDCSLDPSGIIEGANEAANAAQQSGESVAAAETITTEIKPGTAEEVDTNEATSLEVTQVPGDTWTADVPTVTVQTAGMPTATSVPISGTAPPSFKVTAKPITSTDTKQMSASSVEAKQGGTGDITIAPGSVKKNNSGGARSNHSSSPSSGGGGGGGKGSCFVAGTLISTSLGFKPIEQIQKKDIVLSYNKSIGLNEYSKVLQTMIHDTVEPIYTLYIKNEQLRVTGIHRFFVTDKITCGIPQWVHAADLKVGQWVLFADGTWHVIHKIEVNIEHQTVYNFEVSHNHNYYVGRNQILAHNKGGKGGKGGSGSTAKPKTAEKKEAEKYQKKYYEEVDHQLDKVGKTLDKVEETADKLIGTQARTKQNEQIKLLQKELTLQQKKLKILQEQEKVDVAKNIQETDKKLEELLKKQGLDINILDITFDEEGFVKNYDEVGQAITDAQNKLIDKRNALINPDGTISDENEELLKEIDKEISKYDKLGKELIKNIDRYDDIVNEELEIQNELEEIQDKIQDITIDIYKASQEAIDDLKDLRKEWAKFEAMIYDPSKGESFLSLDNPIRQLKEIENELSNIYTISGKEARDYYNDVIAQQEKLKKNATTEDEIKAYDQAIEYYSKIRDSIDDGETLNNGLMQLALNDVVELKKIWDEWDETSRNNPVFGDNKAALKEQLEDAQKRLMKFVEDYEELIEDFKDKSLDIADHTADQWDKQLDRFDRVIDQLDRYSDTYSLIYGDEAYEMQENVLHQQAQTLQQQLDTAKLAYDAANNYYLQAYEKFVDKETGLAKEGYEAYMYELEKARNDAEDKMRDIAADAAKKWAEAFEAAVKNSTQTILQNTIGENNFDHLDRNWEWDKEYTNKYRDDVEKAYELDKLRNRYMDMLNNAQGASLQTQNKIRAQMQEQLDLLNSQTTVSEYDVKLANAKLEVLQKQIALEDAQRNKNKMQLRRDTQGNYRYVYTADKNDVSQAQQELLDSEYDAYEMSKQQQMNNYDDMINAYKRYLSQREEILNNNNLSEAQKMQQIQELWDRFRKYIKAAQEDFKDATAGTVDILQWLVVNGTDYTATAASDMLNQLLDEEGNIVEQSGILWMDLAYKWENEIIPKIEDAIIEADDHIISKMQETHDALVGNDGSSGLLAEVSGGANNFGDQCEIAAQQTEMLANQSIALREALLGDNSAFAEAQDQLANYQRQLEDVANASAITAQTLRDTQEALDRANAENLNYRSQIDRLLSGEDIIVDHKIVNAAEYKRQQEEAKRAASGGGGGGGGGGRNHLADARAIWYNGAWGNGGDWYTPYSRLYGRDNANKVLWYFNHGYGVNFDFDTGGYTGEWDKTDGVAEHKHGKLAFLHQKELVLNESDTKNILEAVSMIREMSTITQNSLSSMGKTSLTNNINSTYNPLTEQRVDIQASFPNATDAEDIRQALIGLSDRAYQYAHKII